MKRKEYEQQMTLLHGELVGLGPQRGDLATHLVELDDATYAELDALAST